MSTAFLRMLMGTLNAMSQPIEDRRIAFTDLGNFGVSTVLSELGFETALGDAGGIWPVERYPTRAEAEKGHLRWVEFARNAKTGTTITMLGFPGCVLNRQVKLKQLNRKEQNEH